MSLCKLPEASENNNESHRFYFASETTILRLCGTRSRPKRWRMRTAYLTATERNSAVQVALNVLIWI